MKKEAEEHVLTLWDHCERLYKDEEGAYYLHIDGSGPTSGTRELTPRDAMLWAKKHAPEGLIKQYFPAELQTEAQATEKDIVCEVEMALFQIHAFARLIEFEDLGRGNSLGDGVSKPVMSLSQVIGEKAEFCLKAIEEMGVTA